MEITIAESKPDMDSLIQQTFCFSPDVLATAKDASNGRAAFFLACEDFGRMFDYSFPACVFFNFIFKVEISSRTLIPLVRRGSARSGRASWDDYGRMFPDKLRVSSFPDRFPDYAWTAV